jgi:hypothetical protein
MEGYDGEQKRVKLQEAEIKLRFQGVFHRQKFRVIQATGTDILVLGMPWLQKHNPNIDWQNIKTGRESQKLDCVKIGPYCVEKKMSNDNYQIALPPRMRIHPVFHISLLSKTNNPVSTKGVDVVNEYEVERILDKRRRDGNTEYLIKWKNYNETDNTWEPTANLNCPDIMEQFHRSRESEELSRRSSKRSIAARQRDAQRK